jgi:hypothetical protein
MSALMTQVSRLPDTWQYIHAEIAASRGYFLETGLDFYDLTPTEQRRKIEEEING